MTCTVSVRRTTPGPRRAAARPGAELGGGQHAAGLHLVDLARRSSTVSVSTWILSLSARWVLRAAVVISSRARTRTRSISSSTRCSMSTRSISTLGRMRDRDGQQHDR